ncbi:MAG: hypothetical protein HON27_06370 [Candidatus Marinimicrobia bacterium]|jgi:TolA-binding protein|nr:hypothetical protein [Candidatus Neomarinimicrobiota bacterium]MBT4360809.1 hypothetical protein [Candidatus Neomarinimicrobiota bacterium]MBT4945776.1 hypothetical protein [Candidatus Neomarinimicrobiota bacterium]MBT5271077.1 hypothetical protein [Candidatus Neomarinimicrobiota bacterium]MBT6012611.1 hypothetical protein [Candidatus Neomarinimicrobiota bacterium]
MLSSSDFTKYLRPVILLVFIGVQSCAYYNTFYNAEEYYAEAQRLTRENQTETVSREEINLYSKAIEKSKKLLTKFPESKYRDDAQFIIAKAYYFKGDFLLAKRHFEELNSIYSNSPHANEVPLWIGRCLMKTGDLEMARYEASRVLKGDKARRLQADALLLMGEIAVLQDSLGLAENYLEQVIDRSPDGFTKAQAQFQVGKMRENEKDYEGALTAYQTISKYKPSESLKVEAIIRQTSMLKALNRDEDAVEMIQDMLLSDKFVEIRGQLEVELGKLYLVMNEIDRAESKLTSIVEDYNRTEVSAEASFYLGELYLTKHYNYNEASTAFTNVKTQSARSPLVTKATQKNKQIGRYEKIQLDFNNYQRELAGLPPLVKAKKSTSKNRSNRSKNQRGRSRSGKPANQRQKESVSRFDDKKNVVIETVEVTAEDTIRVIKLIDENRYSLAEYMLFEFVRVDTTLEILTDLENSTADTSLKHQCAYMQYYAIESIRGDLQGGRYALEQIEKKYPLYYNTIISTPAEIEIESDPNEERYIQVASLFESGQHKAASSEYYSLKEDSTISISIRGKSCFNHAWLNDHFLFNKASAVESYSYMVDHFPEDPLAKTARNRLNALTQDPTQQKEVEEPKAEIEEDDQDAGQKSNQSQDSKKGEDEK